MVRISERLVYARNAVVTLSTYTRFPAVCVFFALGLHPLRFWSIIAFHASYRRHRLSGQRQDDPGLAPGAKARSSRGASRRSLLASGLEGVGYAELSRPGFASDRRRRLDRRRQLRDPDLHLSLPRVDAIVFQQRARRSCLWRIAWRSIFGRGGDRPDLPAGCPEQFDCGLFVQVWRYETVTRPQVEATRRAHGPEVPVVRLRSDREIAAFLAASSPAT